MANSSYANTSTLTTDFNVSPYYDDYSKDKNYYRILYKPGYAVQARELTQMQTILQKQIDRFGKHVFKEGSIVLPGKFTFENDLPYCKVRDVDNAGSPVTISDYVGQTIRGATNGLVGYITNVVDGTEANTNAKTIYVRYQSGNAANNTYSFKPDEVLVCNVGTLIVSNTTANTGLGSRFVIEEGVLFAKEHFIAFPTQSVILDRYGREPTCQVGFNITEEIVDYTTDISLLDPALEATNYAAPGADRLKLTPNIVRLGISENIDSPDYVQLFVVRDGVVQVMFEKSQYSILNDYFAERTFDESGDYYVRGMDVRLREHLNNNVNFGYLTAGDGGNNSLLAVGVEAGRGYVKGYQVGNLTTRWVTTDKSKDYINVNNQITTTRFGNYFIADEYAGVATHNTGAPVFLYDTARQSITNRLWSSGSAVGNVIGTAKLKSVEYDGGTLGTADGTLSVYLFDVQMNGTNAFSQTKSFKVTNSIGSDTYGDVVLDNQGNAILEETTGTLLYPVGTSFIRTIRDSSDGVDTKFSYKKTEAASVSSGIATITLTAGQSFPYGTGFLSDSEKTEILVSVNSDTDITLDGTVIATTLGDYTVTGTGTKFLRLNVGDTVDISSQLYTVASISSDTLMTVREPLSVVSGTIKKVYKAGSLIDLRTLGVDAGLERTVEVTSTTSMTIDLKETAITAATVTYRVAINSAREMEKILRPNRFVLIDCSTAGTTGPFNLGVPDLYQVRQIRVSTDAFNTNTDGTLATANFKIDNGQRDEFYDHATITPKSGYSLTASSKILVEFDYFYTDSTLGNGYFSVDSYPIDDANVSSTTIATAQIPRYRSTQTNALYDLRDYLDFRPLKSITATDTTSISVATANKNPPTTTSFDSGSIRIPAPQSQLDFDYSYYLPRKDVVAIDRDNNIILVRGEPAVVPVTPSIDQKAPNSMALATLYIAPWPSIAPQYADALKRKDISSSVIKTAPVRFTMRDIGVLKNRIENVEYYASLNALEKNALDFKILDENGLDRFKNGIFVDTFADHTLGATYDPEYQIVVDPEEKSIRPLYDMESVPYRLISSSSIRKHQNDTVLTLDYTNTPFITQNGVSTARNIETSVYKFIGNMEIDPPQDFWVDTQYAPDNSVTVGSNNYTSGPLSTTWNAWQKKIVGYKLYDKSSGRLLATFNNREDAYKNAQALSRNKTINQNTIGYTGQKISTVIEEVTENTRVGSQNYQETTTDQQSLGDRVIDTSLIPYIRPQTLTLRVRGLKANTQFYTFFDNEKMSTFLSPLSNTGLKVGSVSFTQGGSSIVSNTWPVFDSYYYAPQTAGNTWISSPSGELFGQLRLPGEDGATRFRVGTKEVVVTDNPTNDPAATSAAKGFWTAQGVQQVKQDTILTTRQTVVYSREATETELTTTQFTQPLGPSCMAYSFLAKAPQGEEGLFMTGADVFIKSVHPQYGVWFEIREMDAAGGITRTQVPFSEVWYKSTEIQPYTSEDASKAFRVTFPAPVFLYNNKQYAFVIHTEGLNPDTYFWVSRLGDTDVITGNKINSRPLTGTLYTTNNNLNWDIVPDLDLKAIFYRASFTVGNGNATIGNKNIEVLELSETSAPLRTYGENFISTRLGLTGNTSAISVGTVLVGSNSTTTVLAIDTETPAYIVSANTSLINERMTIAGSSNTTVATVSRANGVLSKFVVTDTNTVARLINSYGTFRANDIIIGETSGTTGTVKFIANLAYSLVDYEPTYVNFSKTSCGFKMSTTGAAPLYPIIENENVYYNSEQTVKSQSFSGTTPDNQVRIDMGTATTYLSPFVDLATTHSVLVKNIINSNTLNETQATGGELINKYISKVTTLAEGQDAEDVVIAVTAYRPPETNVHVYMKISNGEDFETIASKEWTEMAYVDDTVYSSVSDRDDFKEYTFKFPSTMMDANTGIVSYTNSAGTKFLGYKQFAIKVGLSSDNPAVVPRVADLRVIAVQL